MPSHRRSCPEYGPPVSADLGRWQLAPSACGGAVQHSSGCGSAVQQCTWQCSAGHHSACGLLASACNPQSQELPAVVCTTYGVVQWAWLLVQPADTVQHPRAWLLCFSCQPPLLSCWCCYSMPSITSASGTVTRLHALRCSQVISVVLSRHNDAAAGCTKDSGHLCAGCLCAQGASSSVQD